MIAGESISDGSPSNVGSCSTIFFGGAYQALVPLIDNRGDEAQYKGGVKSLSYNTTHHDKQIDGMTYSLTLSC